MDTLTTPVLLVTIATNSRKASVGRIASNSRKTSVFYRAVRVLYSGQQRAQVSLRQSASEVSLRQSVSRNQSASVGRASQSSVSPRSETSAQCSSVSGIRGATTDIVLIVTVHL
jgi:hypothetical protein